VIASVYVQYTILEIDTTLNLFYVVGAGEQAYRLIYLAIG